MIHIQKYIPLAARVFLSAIFLFSGVTKLINFSGTVAWMESFGFSIAGLFLIGSIIIELGVGLSLVLGYKAKYSAFVLAVYLVIVSAVFHFDFSDPNNPLTLLRHLGMIGGLLLISVYGAGPVSIDKLVSSK